MTDQSFIMLLAVVAVLLVVGVWLVFVATAITRRQPIWTLMMVCFPLVALLYIPEYLGGEDEDEDEDEEPKTA